MKRGIARRKRQLLAWAVLLALLLPGCDRLETLVRGDRCVLSDREVHAKMAVRVVVESEAKSGDACCLRCAINYALQTNRTVRVLSVTDYDSGRRLSPGDAVYVVASEVRPCSGSISEATNDRSGCLVLSWDRCDPSIIAFSSEAKAERFQNEHGGQIKTFGQIARQAPGGRVRSD